MKFRIQRLHRIGILALSLSVSLILINYVWDNRNSSFHQQAARFSNDSLSESVAIENQVTNTTLGFESIIAINLAARTDRRDLLTLMSSYQGVHLNWQNAVRGTEMDEKAWPSHWNTSGTQSTSGELGLWRSHVNALRHVVETGYSTALIIEDDVDWDVSFKSQLVDYARHLQNLTAPVDSLTQLSSSSSVQSPYGPAWDMLWLGTCANPPAPNGTLWYDDLDGRRHALWYADGGLACTWGYAVTLESARMLLGFSLDLSEAYDLHISSFCETHNCAIVWPPLIANHRPAGSRRKFSDVQQETLDSSDVTVEAESRGIVHSAILDMLSRISPKKFSAKR
ncbi:uncharacterized protein KY384_006186 [Bacidia gigantensis]|uniref:uncharacterized protein n=1 Tax=Bacidia gigantensis TaxID=2732470 RepID=UPI001D05AF51|nr:uncharacterized protein KY384_006186 [Bacidia gigantensis]KAG8529549.1 hypothetical protein KY384_006186 [Bacidia gigantensis]